MSCIDSYIIASLTNLLSDLTQDNSNYPPESTQLSINYMVMVYEAIENSNLEQM